MSEHLKDVKHIIAVHSAKGGVGKSTLTANLAVGLAQRGAKVGLLDADIHGPSAAMMMGNTEWPDPGKDENTIHPVEAHGVKFISMGNIVTRETPLIWRGAMVHSVITQFLANVLWGELDYLLIDMPPGTGDAQLSLAQAVPLTGAVIISTPQELALVDSLRGISGFKQLKVPILGLVENMSVFVCDDCGERTKLFGDSGATMMAEEMGIANLGSVPLEPAVCDAGDNGKPVILSHPESASARSLESILDKFQTTLADMEPMRAFDLAWKEMGWDERNPEPPTRNASDAPVKAVWQVSSDELGICWPDDSITTFSAKELRLACPCAACIDEWTGQPILDPKTVPDDIRFIHIRSVGNYAFQPTFSDNHSSGLFHFGRLRALAEAK